MGIGLNRIANSHVAIARWTILGTFTDSSFALAVFGFQGSYQEDADRIAPTAHSISLMGVR